MATRPSLFPRWAETAGGTPDSNIAEPTSDKKDVGWQDSEQPPSGILNWLLWLIYKWLAYFDATNGGGLFGDGADGAATFDGSATPAGASKSGSDYTLTRDVAYTNATFSANCTLNTAGFRMSVSGTLDCSAANVVIFCDGGAGGSGVSGGAAGARSATGILGSDTNNAGTAGTGGGASTGRTLTAALGGAGGAGGTGTSTTPAGSSTATAPTATQGGLHNAVSLLLGMLFGVSAVAPVQGGAGGTGGTGSGGGTTGGGGGGGGGCLWLHAYIVRFAASTVVRAKGGNGGLGQVSAGGGGGGGGGFVCLRYRSQYPGSTAPSACVSVAGGTGGQGNNGGGGGMDGSNGATGNYIVAAV